MWQKRNVVRRGGNAVTGPRLLHGCRQRPGGFDVSLVRNTGGEPTPVEAAQTFIRTGGIWSSPQNGWRVTSEDQSGATLVAPASSLHAVRLADATWAVDSGSRCSG